MSQRQQRWPPGAIFCPNRGEVGANLWAWSLTGSVPWGSRPISVEGSQVAWQRNVGVEQFLDQHQLEWLLCLDSDMAPEWDQLPRLLASDRPVVSALCLTRGFPFPTTAWAAADRVYRVTDLVDAMAADATLPAPGLPLVAVGTGALLIWRDVLERMASPWFRCGQVDPQLLQEDTNFCDRAAAAGFPPAVVTGARVGHRTGGVTLWPGADGRVWAQWAATEDVRSPIRIREDEEVLHERQRQAVAAARLNGRESAIVADAGSRR